MIASKRRVLTPSAVRIVFACIGSQAQSDRMPLVAHRAQERRQQLAHGSAPMRA